MDTIKLSKFDLQKLNDGYSTTAVNKTGEMFLITFEDIDGVL